MATIVTEATQVNDAIRRNLGPLGLFRRVEHAYESGWADWYFRLRGVSGWIEAKLAPRSGRCPDHLTLDQLFWGEEEVRAGGTWFLLVLREPRTWCLFDPVGARTWHVDRTMPPPLIQAEGRFPTVPIALKLSGRG